MLLIPKRRSRKKRRCLMPVLRRLVVVVVPYSMGEMVGRYDDEYEKEEGMGIELELALRIVMGRLTKMVP